MTGPGPAARRRPRVVVLDYGSGNLRSAQRALVRAGADADVTADGSFELKGPEGKGIPKGKYKVTVRQADPFPMGKPIEWGAGKNKPIEREVKGGSEEIMIDVINP